MPVLVSHPFMGPIGRLAPMMTDNKRLSVIMTSAGSGGSLAPRRLSTMPTLATVASLARSLPALRDLPGLDPDHPGRLAAVGLAPFDPAALAATVTADLARLEQLARSSTSTATDVALLRSRDAAARRYAAAALVLSCVHVDALDIHRSAAPVADDFHACDLWELLTAKDRHAFLVWLGDEQDKDASDPVRQVAIERLARQVFRRAERSDALQPFTPIEHP